MTEIAFPATGLLDDFNRANEGPPPSSRWLSNARALTDAGMKVVSNQLTCATAPASAGWLGGSYNPDMEVYLAVGVANPEFELFFRGHNIGGSGFTTYCAYYNPAAGGTVKVRRYTAAGGGVYTDIGGAVARTMPLGSALGARIVGPHISVYVNDDPGGLFGPPQEWVLLLERTDTTYQEGSFIGMATYTVSPYDNWSGGRMPVFRGSDTSFRDAAEERIYAALPWPEAQAKLSEPGLEGGRPTAASCGWHGTGLDPERGSFALVAHDGPLAGLVGERLAISRRDATETRTVYVYVHADSDTLTEEISVTRRVFMGLGDPALEDVPVVVEVIA